MNCIGSRVEDENGSVRGFLFYLVLMNGRAWDVQYYWDLSLSETNIRWFL